MKNKSDLNSIKNSFSQFKKAEDSYIKNKNKENDKYKINSTSLNNDIRAYKTRLANIKASGLNRNKDGTINRKYNKGKEAVTYTDLIPQLESQVTGLKKTLDNRIEKLTKDFKKTNNRLISKIKESLNNIYNSYFLDKQNINQIIAGIHEQSFSKTFTANYDKFKNDYEDILSDEEAKVVLDKYMSKVSFTYSPFDIKFPRLNYFLNLLLNNKYSKYRRIVFWLRYNGLISIPLLSFVTPQNQDEFNKTASYLLLVWVITFLISFFYKRKKRKVHKLVKKELGDTKNKIDEKLKKVSKKNIIDYVNKNIKVNLNNFIKDHY